MPWTNNERRERFNMTLLKMKALFEADPAAAVRSQNFIQTFHRFIASDLESHLTSQAKNAGIQVIQEAKIFGSFKSKDVDVAVIHPINGPLLLIGGGVNGW